MCGYCNSIDRRRKRSSDRVATIHRVTILGVDLGTRRVGIAVSSSGVLATPHSVIENPGDAGRLADRLTELADAEGAELFVLGVPTGGRRDAAEIAARFQGFADQLRQRSCRDVVLWDESYSTVEAARQRREAGAKRRQSGSIDMYAAAVILQSYLDARGRSS